MNYCVLLAGGRGQRVANDIPKQYTKARGHMMISYALMPLLSCKVINEVYIVAEQEWRNVIVSEIEKMGLETSKIAGFALPGDNRQTSILNGMEEIIRRRSDENLDILDDDTIIVHDAARPFLSEDIINSCYEALEEHDGVMPILPMKDTVYYSEDGRKVSKLLERQKIYAGQTPELFRLRKYYDANVSLTPLNLNEVNGATEPAILFGMDIVMIPGDENNFKVTTKEDMIQFVRIKEGDY